MSPKFTGKGGSGRTVYLAVNISGSPAVGARWKAAKKYILLLRSLPYIVKVWGSTWGSLASQTLYLTATLGKGLVIMHTMFLVSGMQSTKLRTY